MELLLLRRPVPDLGLAIVASIVQAHGGRVTLETVVGQGARFEVHLLPHRTDLSAPAPL